MVWNWGGGGCVQIPDFSVKSKPFVSDRDQLNGMVVSIMFHQFLNISTN